MGDKPWIELNTRNLGMSVDEYAGWSFFYSEWIQTHHSTKGFRLWKWITETQINNRTNGDIVAIDAIYDSALYGDYYRPLYFTKDWCLEAYVDRVGSPSSYFWDYWWPIYRQQNSVTIINGICIWDYIVLVYPTGIHLITRAATGNFWIIWDNIVTSPDFSDAWDWTVWANRTLSASWATHTAWSTAVLSQVIPTSNTKKYRVVIKHTKTAWSISVKFDAGTAHGFSWTDEYIITSPITAAGDNQTLNIVPSSDYNWTIELIQINEYVATIEEWKITTLQNYSSHPLLFSMWTLYVASGSQIEMISTTTWTEDSTKLLIDSTYTIIAMTQVWQNILIWATDGKDSKQYYWDWVSDVAQEVIDWKGTIISAAVSDETTSYVVTGWKWFRPKVYMVDWASRVMIAGKQYDWSNNGTEWTWYHPSKRFNFYVDSPKAITIWWKNLYIPTKWCVYTFGTDIALMDRSWDNSIKYTTALDKPIQVMSVVEDIPYLTYQKLVWATTYNMSGIVTDRKPTESWYLVTNPIFWDSFSSVKDITKLRIWYKNVPSTNGDIKVYAIVDDYKFWTFTVSWVTTTPSVWDTYKIWSSTVIVNMEVISTDITGWAGTITLKTTNNLRWAPYSLLETGTLIKLAWDGDSTITYTYFNNMVLLKTITSDEIEYWNALIFWKDFVDTHMPKRHKFQLVVELSSDLDWYGVFPEIYEINLLADITDDELW